MPRWYAARLNFTDDQRDISSEAIGVGLQTGNGAIADGVELGIVEHDTASLLTFVLAKVMGSIVRFPTPAGHKVLARL
jgi:hypothetical protein